MTTCFIDCHAHLFTERSLPIEEQRKQWQQANVAKVLHIFCLEEELEQARENIDQLSQQPDILMAAGVTPHGADKYSQQTADFLYQHHQQLVAVGEIGLDFHYNFASPETQEKVFRNQLDIAVDLQKPVVLHLREADEKAQQILSEYKDSLPGIMLHCYTCGEDLAKWAISQNMYLSASGIVTFKKSQELRDIFQQVPLEQLLVETDAPYLAPHPLRGKTNQPAYVVKTYEFLADMYGVTTDKLANQVWQNSQQLFQFAK